MGAMEQQHLPVAETRHCGTINNPVISRPRHFENIHRNDLKRGICDQLSRNHGTRLDRHTHVVIRIIPRQLLNLS